jgi:hypothetical protein
MSQDRLQQILDAAVAGARACPAWRDGDELAVIAADPDGTRMTTRGFGTGGLIECLDLMAADVRVAANAEGRLT